MKRRLRSRPDNQHRYTINPRPGDLHIYSHPTPSKNEKVSIVPVGLTMLNQYNSELKDMESVEKTVVSGGDIEMSGQLDNSTELGSESSDRHEFQPPQPGRSYQASRQINSDFAHLASGNQVQPLLTAPPISVPASSIATGPSNEPSSQDSSPSVPGPNR